MVDMAADDAVIAAAQRLVRQRFLEAVDGLDRLLHPPLQPLRQRPVGIAHPPPRGVEPAVQQQRRVIGPVPQMGEQRPVAHHAVEFVAMHHQQPAAIGGDVLGLLRQPDARDLQPHPVAEHLVVVAGDIEDFHALARPAQQQADHLVMRAVPEPGLPQPPAIHDVAHQHDPSAIRPFQEIQQQIRPAGTKAQMQVGQEHRAVVALRECLLHPMPAGPLRRRYRVCPVHPE